MLYGALILYALSSGGKKPVKEPAGCAVTGTKIFAPENFSCWFCSGLIIAACGNDK